MLRSGGGSARPRTLVLLLLASITVLTLDARGFGPLDTLRDGVSSLLAPVRDAAGSLPGVGDSFGGSDSAEVRELQMELDDLRGAEARAENLEAELQALREQLGQVGPPEIPTATARVVGRPVSNFERTVELDKGANAGIEVGMPVVTRAGLVGTVTRVTFNRSFIELLTDPEFRVGVRDLSTGEVGIARGTGEGEPLIVDSLASEVDVAQDQLFETTGFDRSRFPRAIPVGRATRPLDSGSPLEQSVELDPAADLSRLDFVLIMLVDNP